MGLKNSLHDRFEKQMLLLGFNKFKSRILVAVSGGKDSMALLNLFYESGFTVQVAHFNFKLRDKESDLDEKWVKEYCELRNIKFHSKSENTSAYAEVKKISTQMAARELRYEWFKELLNRENLDYIATAHHLNDDLETLLLNFTKGTGPKGLRGIPKKTNKIIRPLLNFTQKEILEYLGEKDIGWRDDQSNFKNDYSRNKIRNQVIPLLKEINPGLEKTFETNLKRFESLNAIFEEQMKLFSEAINQADGHLPFELIKNTTGISLILEEYLKPYGFNRTDIESLMNIEEAGKILLSENYQLTGSRGYWILEEKKESSKFELFIEKPGGYPIFKGKITLEINAKKPVKQDFIDPNIAVLDANLIQWPLLLRNWQSGDRFRPFGMNGSKLVSDFLKDQKVSPEIKNRQLVVKDVENILWIVGHRIHEDYKITEKSKNFLYIKLESYN